MRLTDLVVEHLSKEYDVEVVFTVTGGGAMYLNDAFGRAKNLKYIALHHEQSVSMAAEAYSRIGNRIGVCQITTGPGGTNAISGCAGAWIDSTPLIFISGQVETYSNALVGNRQTGVQEVDIVSLVKSITKDARKITDPTMILYELDRLIHLSKTGRPGPVWIDIPLDIQNYQFNQINNLPRFKPQLVDKRSEQLLQLKVKKLVKYIENAKRPIICIGNGCRHAMEVIHRIALDRNIPIVLGWNAKDLISSTDPILLGSIGLFGDRISNMMVSRADLIIGIGFRFSVPQIGYNPSMFGQNAIVASVDIDPAEGNKYGGFIDYFIQADSLEFSKELDKQIGSINVNFGSWLDIKGRLKKLNLDAGPRSNDVIDSFDFTDCLSRSLPNNCALVTDMGTSFTCTHQQIQLKSGMRMMTSSGLAAMGFGLPGAIGAALVDGLTTTVLITGDGGLMFNLQEIQSVLTHKLALKIIVYENEGYLTMKHMQKNRFNRYVCSDPGSLVDCPDFIKIANAFGLVAREISHSNEMEGGLSWLFENLEEPALLVVHLDPMQDLTPRVQTESDESGNLLPGNLGSMYPFLGLDLKNKIKSIFDE